MVFGGQSDKLNPDGPFLQLRSQFETDLFKSNSLLVIGYSFADRHLNALIRSWVATRERAKITVLDPGPSPFSEQNIGEVRRFERGKPVKWLVELKHVQKTAADGITEALEECLKRPRPELNSRPSR